MTGKEDVAQALIESGVDVNFGNPPPITIAAQMGRINSVKLMIEHNVNVSAEIFFIFFFYDVSFICSFILFQLFIFFMIFFFIF